MLQREGRLPDSLVAAIGGGSNAMGLFHPFLDDKGVEIYRRRSGGLRLRTGKHAASITGGRPGVLHGNRTYLLKDEDGQITEAHSISAGLDYPGIGPEHVGCTTCSVSIRVGDRRRGPGSVPIELQARRHHSGA